MSSAFLNMSEKLKYEKRYNILLKIVCPRWRSKEIIYKGIE